MLCDRHVQCSSRHLPDDRFEAAVLPVGCVMQRRLVAACIVAAFSLVPLTAQAASAADVDALWNQPQGVSADSAFYVVQEWWDGLTRTTSDPIQRGLAELAQANADLLNTYTLLQQQRSGAGPQPVAVIDPFLSGIYNFITGSDAKAPVGSLLSWPINPFSTWKAVDRRLTSRSHCSRTTGHSKPRRTATCRDTASSSPCGRRTPIATARSS